MSMRHLWLLGGLTAALLLVVGCGSNSSSPPRDVVADQVAAARVIQSYADAVNSGNAEAFVALFTDDAIWMPANSAPVVGREAIRKRVHDALEELSLDKVFHVEEIVVSGSWAFVRTRAEGTVIFKSSGKKETERDNGFYVLQRQQNGSWKIARYIYNSSIPLEH